MVLENNQDKVPLRRNVQTVGACDKEAFLELGR